MARPGIIDIADGIFHGAITNTITELRSEGASHERIAFMLVALYNIPVSRITVLRHLQRQHILAQLNDDDIPASTA